VPVEERGIDAVTGRLVGGVGLGLVAAGHAPDDEARSGCRSRRTPGAA
jgi:hypothetical protein